MIDAIVARLQTLGLAVATGRFGGHMEVDLVNNGPVTVLVDV